MNFYACKAQLTRNGKVKKELYLVEASHIIAAEAVSSTNLVSEDPDVIITDINTKNYVNVFTNEVGDSYYDVVIEFEDIDGKTVKEMYLQQSTSTKSAEETLNTNVSGDYEVKSVKETNIIDYFKKGEE